jgi:hypothetical protein
MKLKSVLLVVVGLLSMSGVYAKSTTSDNLVAVSVNHIAFNKFGDYLDAMKKTKELYKSNKLNVERIDAYSFYGNKIWFSIPLDDISDFDILSQSLQNISDKNGSNILGGDFSEATSEFVNKRELMLMQYQPELSYIPKDNRLKPEDRKYVRKQRFKINPGKMESTFELMKQFKTLFESINSKSAVEIYTGYIDKDLPYIDIFRFAKSAEDYHAYEDQINEAIGAENFQKLGKGFMEVIRGESVEEGKVYQFLGYQQAAH